MQGVTLEFAAYDRLGEVFPDMDFDEHPQKDALIAAVMDVAQEFAQSELAASRGIQSNINEQ